MRLLAVFVLLFVLNLNMGLAQVDKHCSTQPNQNAEFSHCHQHDNQDHQKAGHTECKRCQCLQNALIIVEKNQFFYHFPGIKISEHINQMKASPFLDGPFLPPRA